MFKTHTNINSTDNTPINGGHKQQINLRVPCRQNIYTAQPQHAAAWEAPVVQARHGRERSLRTRSNVHGPPSCFAAPLGAVRRAWRARSTARGARLRAPQGCAAQGTSVSVSKMTSLSKKSSASSGAGPCESQVGLGFTRTSPTPNPYPYPNPNLNPNPITLTLALTCELRELRGDLASGGAAGCSRSRRDTCRSTMSSSMRSK